MTKLNYLFDTYIFESLAKVAEVGENEIGKYLILDETIFYPQGGGQKSDSGRITSSQGTFIVSVVRMDQNGQVFHYGEFENGSFVIGESVDLKVDGEGRKLLARLHSAGHLLDCAVTKLQIPGLKPTKGFHFPEGSYVEYEGNLENPMEYVSQVEKVLNELVEQDLKVKIKEITEEEVKKCGIWVPEGKSARTVSFEGFSSCGCGGTHVKSSVEIGKVKIRKMVNKKGSLRISYKLEEV